MAHDKLVLIPVFLWGIATFLYKLANNHIHPVLVASVSALIYVAAIPIYPLIFKEKYNWDFQGIIYVMIGAIIMCSGTLANNFALQKGSLGSTVMITGLYPIVSTVLSMIFLGEEISVKKVFGIILAIVAIQMVR